LIQVDIEYTHPLGGVSSLTTSIMDKSEIRKIFKKKRSELSSDYVKIHSDLIAKNFSKNFSDISNQKLAFYLAANNEVDPKFIINNLKNSGNIIALPKIQINEKILSFKEYKDGDELEKNISYSKLLEPKSSSINVIPDIVFVPLVACDINCNRVGMGSGFYDATISYFRMNNKKIKFIGLAYDMQFCDKINNDKWDQSLDFIVSETRVIFPEQ
jgi:5-formyltetrahydrofolate cyclo-ligase